MESHLDWTSQVKMGHATSTRFSSCCLSLKNRLHRESGEQVAEPISPQQCRRWHPSSSDSWWATSEWSCGAQKKFLSLQAHTYTIFMLSMVCGWLSVACVHSSHSWLVCKPENHSWTAVATGINDRVTCDTSAAIFEHVERFQWRDVCHNARPTRWCSSESHEFGNDLARIVLHTHVGMRATHRQSPKMSARSSHLTSSSTYATVFKKTIFEHVIMIVQVQNIVGRLLLLNTRIIEMNVPGAQGIRWLASHFFDDTSFSGQCRRMSIAAHWQGPNCRFSVCLLLTFLPSPFADVVAVCIAPMSLGAEVSGSVRLVCKRKNIRPHLLPQRVKLAANPPRSLGSESARVWSDISSGKLRSVKTSEGTLAVRAPARIPQKTTQTGEDIGDKMVRTGSDSLFHHAFALAHGQIVTWTDGRVQR